jgi:hypothetical protein
MPLSANSPTCSTFTAFSTFVSTRGLLRFPGLCNIGNRPDGGIIEANCAERGEPVRNTDAEADFVPQPTPLLSHAPIASRISTLLL